MKRGTPECTSKTENIIAPPSPPNIIRPKPLRVIKPLHTPIVVFNPQNSLELHTKTPFLRDIRNNNLRSGVKTREWGKWDLVLLMMHNCYGDQWGEIADKMGDHWNKNILKHRFLELLHGVLIQIRAKTRYSLSQINSHKYIIILYFVQLFLNNWEDEMSSDLVPQTLHLRYNIDKSEIEEFSKNVQSDYLGGGDNMNIIMHPLKIKKFLIRAFRTMFSQISRGKPKYSPLEPLTPRKRVKEYGDNSIKENIVSCGMPPYSTVWISQPTECSRANLYQVSNLMGDNANYECKSLNRGEGVKAKNNKGKDTHWLFQ